jgi:hypothetical protein
MGGRGKGWLKKFSWAFREIIPDKVFTKERQERNEA